MSLSSTTNKVIYAGSGATTEWPFSFPVFDAAHLRVVFTDASGIETVLSAALYDVAGIGNPAGGTVIYPKAGTPIPSGTRITLLRIVPYSQDTVLSNQGGYYPEVVERRFDEIYMALQQLEERVSRASLYALSDPVTEQSNLDLIRNLQPMNVLTTAGDLLTHNGSTYKALARGGATQVLGGGANLAWREVVMPKMHIHGLTYSRSAANTIDIASGGCMSDDGTDWISYAGGIGVAIDSPFGSGAGSLDAGSVANADYWIHLILNPSTGAVKPLTSLSRTAPTLPANYTKKRVVGWIRRSSSAIADFVTYETAGGGLRFLWKTPGGVSTTGSTSRQLHTMPAPVGIQTLVSGVNGCYDNTNIVQLRVECPDATPTGGPSLSTSPQSTPSFNGHGFFQALTDSSARVASLCNYAAQAIWIQIHEFEWSRR